MMAFGSPQRPVDALSVNASHLRYLTSESLPRGYIFVPSPLRACTRFLFIAGTTIGWCWHITIDIKPWSFPSLAEHDKNDRCY